MNGELLEDKCTNSINILLRSTDRHYDKPQEQFLWKSFPTFDLRAAESITLEWP